jgi:hypothetical protein
VPYAPQYRSKSLIPLALVVPNDKDGLGAVRLGARFVRFGWPGCPDLLGQLKDGRLLGVEVKGPAGKLRPAQVVFLERIRAAGGVAFMARDCRDVRRELQALEGKT